MSIFIKLRRWITPSQKFGIVDTADGSWLGDDDGPSVFADVAVARVAAQVAEVQITGSDSRVRFQVRRWRSWWPVRLKDELPTRLSRFEAVRQIEDQRRG